MAGKNSRSSKTAHVLNLLSGGTPEVKPDAVPPLQGSTSPRPFGACPPCFRHVRAGGSVLCCAPSLPAHFGGGPQQQCCAVREHPHCAGIRTSGGAGLLGADCRPLSGPSCISRFRSGGRGFSPGFGHSAPHSFCSRSLSFRAGAGIHRAVRRRRALQCDAALGGGKAGTLCKAVWPLQLSPLSGGRRALALTGSRPNMPVFCQICSPPSSVCTGPGMTARSPGRSSGPANL